MLCQNLFGYLEKLLGSVSGLTDDHSSTQDEVAGGGESETGLYCYYHNFHFYVRQALLTFFDFLGLPS